MQQMEKDPGYPDEYGDERRFIPPPKPTSEQLDDRAQVIRYVLFAYNLIIFLVGCVLVGVGIWMAVDRNFMTFITGNPVFAAGTYLLIVAGGIIFFIAFIGCCGAMTASKCMLRVFFVLLVIIACTLVVAGVIAIVFRSQLQEKIKDSMRTSLKEQYGVKFDEWWNRAVTDAWDKAQERLFCCGVNASGWTVYRDTEWFKNFGAYYETKGQKFGDEEKMPYVPQSCCVTDRFWRFVDVETCQKWRLGPPGQPDGAFNRALYYEGCYDAGVRYLKENAGILIGLGIAFAVMMGLGIFLSCYLLRSIPDRDIDQ